MRASLVSATSILALLLPEGGEAVAGPVINVGASTPFYYVLRTTSDAGTDTASPMAADTYLFSPLTTGVALTTLGNNDSASYLMTDRSPLAKLAGFNTSDGSFSNAHRYRMAGETVGAGNSVFVGINADLSLLDEPSGSTPAASASFGYTMPSVATGAPVFTAAAGGDDQSSHAALPATTPQSGSMPKVAAQAWAGGLPRVVPRGPSGLISVSQPVADTVNDSASGRIFSGSIAGSSARNPRDPPVDRAPGPGVSNNSAYSHAGEVANTFYILLQRTTGNANSPTGRFTVLPVEGYGASRLDVSTFNISSSLHGRAADQPASILVPMRIVGTGGGELPSSLMIFTAESAAADEAGDSFTYFFNRDVVR